MKKYSGIIMLLLFTLSGKGQQLLFNNVSNQLGLPAQETYNVMQDSRGFIWISTEAGLCKYNGTYCSVFDKKNGLEENSCYDVKEDSKGGLWMLTSANHVLHYENDSLKEAPFSKKITSQINKGLTESYNLCFKNDSVVINMHEETFISGMNSSEVLTMFPDTTCSYYFIKNNNSFINVKSFANQLVMNKAPDEGFVTFGFQDGKNTKRIKINYNRSSEPSWRVLTAVNKKGENFISFSNELVKLNPDFTYSVYEMPSEIISLYCDNDAGLWAGTAKGGVHYFADTRYMSNEIISLKSFSVSGICVDAENGVWCTTLEKGVYYSRNKNVLDYSNNSDLNKPADFLKYEGGNVFASAGTNQIIRFDKQNIVRTDFNLLDNDISDILKDANGWIITGKSFVAKTDEKFQQPFYFKNQENKFLISGRELTFVNDRRLFLVNFGELIEIVNNKSVLRKMPIESPGRCISYIGNNVLLYGCRNGLYKMFIGPEDSQGQFQTEKIRGIDGMVSKIFKSSSGQIWISTLENGLYTLTGDSVVNMTTTLKLPTDRFFDITEDRFGTIWLGSNVGLISIKQEKNNYKIKTYNNLNGLPSNEIYAVAIDTSFVYLSSSEGICSFPLNVELENTVSPSVFIDSLKVNGVACSAKEPFQLPYNSNSLKIELSILTFKKINTPSLYYVLKGADQIIYKEETIKGNIVTIDNLRPGVYELKIYAVNNNGVKSTHPVTIHFEIQKAFWQKTWFVILCAVCFILLVYVIAKLVIKRIRKKEEQKTLINKQLAEFQLTALQAQMNPHFIFNAINSIQNYILKKKEQEAYDYLAKFSKLIRIVLNNSEQKILSLEEELETVKLYIELEQLRFEKNFKFELNVDENVDQSNIEIPTMFIQPYVENAIWHGLMNLDDERNAVLKINISIENSLLKIVIEDNGIGREQAAKYKKKSVHQPVAMKLTEKRLSMINMMEDYIGAQVLIKDLMDESGNAVGTRVEIFLPVILN